MSSFPFITLSKEQLALTSSQRNHIKTEQREQGGPDSATAVQGLPLPGRRTPHHPSTSLLLKAFHSQITELFLGFKTEGRMRESRVRRKRSTSLASSREVPAPCIGLDAHSFGSGSPNLP